MLRAILILIALAIVVVIGMTATGWMSFTQTQNPQAPKFEVKVNDIDVGTTTRQIEVPSVTIDKSTPAGAADNMTANPVVNAQ